MTNPKVVGMQPKRPKLIGFLSVSTDTQDMARQWGDLDELADRFQIDFARTMELSPTRPEIPAKCWLIIH